MYLKIHFQESTSEKKRLQLRLGIDLRKAQTKEDIN